MDATQSFNCSLCNKVYKSKKSLKRHVQSHSESEKYTCACCFKDFKNKSSLRRHILNCHPLSESNFQCCNQIFRTEYYYKRHCSKHTNVQSYSCSNCLKKFKTKFNLKRHLKSHDTEKAFRCPLCDFTNTKVNLNGHFTQDHNINIKSETINLTNFNDFLSWKKRTEHETNSSFVIVSSYKRKDGSSKMLYRCHRDGTYVTSAKKRNSKVLGSNKINAYCPSNIDVTVENSQIFVQFISTHVGHKTELERLRLSMEDKDILAQKIALKIPFDTILNDVQILNGRIHLLTKKDLFNIQKIYNLNHESIVESWIDMESQTDPDLNITGQIDENFENKKAEIFQKCIGFINKAQNMEQLNYIENILAPLEPILEAMQSNNSGDHNIPTSVQEKIEPQKKLLLSTKKITKNVSKLSVKQKIPKTP